jgi:flagellar motor component MotA
MTHSAVIGISASVLCLAAGVAIVQSVPAWAGIGQALGALGAAGAATALALAAAWALGLAGRGRAAEPAGDQSLERLVQDLNAHAATASERGILLLASARVGEQQALFDEGVRMLVRADQPAQMRAQLASMAQRDSEQRHASRRTADHACRLIPVVCASAALSGVLYILVLMFRGEPLGTLTPAVALLGAYGAFGIIAMTSRTARRLEAEFRRRELAAELVIEALARLREGDRPEQVRSALTRLLNPGRPEGLPTLRRAA